MKFKVLLMGLLNISAAVIPMFECKASEKISDELDMIVGTYTNTDSKGIYSMKFNQATGEWKMLGDIFVVNPSYLTLSPEGNYIYAVSETSDSSASVYALRFDKASGKMEIINRQPTVGTDPCYIATNGHVVVTANYGGSMNVFSIGKNGSVGNLQMGVVGETGGPDAVRQIKPHVHCAEFSPDGKLLAVSDFSSDRLMLFEVVENGMKIEPVITDENKNLAVEVEADSGPRHIVFSNNGRYAYLLGELSGKITVFDVEGKNLVAKQTIVADPLKGRASGDIHISPDGRFLYASIRRANDGIAIYRINEETGELRWIGYERTGEHPRNFAITPNGRYLLCACRDCNRIDIFEIDIPTGLLIKTGKVIDLPKPVCIKFD